MVYFIILSTENSHLSCIWHKILVNMYEFTIYVSTEYYMMSTKWTLQTIILSYFIYISLFRDLLLSYSFIRHPTQAWYDRLNDLSIFRIHNVFIWMNIDDNYVGILFSKRLFCYNMFIHQFQPKFNDSFSKRVYYLSIYSSYYKFIGMNDCRHSF